MSHRTEVHNASGNNPPTQSQNIKVTPLLPVSTQSQSIKVTPHLPVSTQSQSIVMTSLPPVFTPSQMTPLPPVSSTYGSCFTNIQSTKVLS